MDDWGDINKAILLSRGVFSAIFILIFIFLMSYIFLNLFIGLIVDFMTQVKFFINNYLYNTLQLKRIIHHHQLKYCITALIREKKMTKRKEQGKGHTINKMMNMKASLSGSTTIGSSSLCFSYKC